MDEKAQLVNSRMYVGDKPDGTSSPKKSIAKQEVEYPISTQDAEQKAEFNRIVHEFDSKLKDLDVIVGGMAYRIANLMQYDDSIRDCIVHIPERSNMDEKSITFNLSVCLDVLGRYIDMLDLLNAHLKKIVD